MIECILPLGNRPLLETENLQLICGNLSSLEEVILAAAAGYSKCCISAMPDQHERVLVIEVQPARTFCLDKIASGMIFIRQEQLQHYSYAAIPKTFKKIGKKKKSDYDTSWFEKRDKRLRIRYENRLDDYLAPPASLAELVLSYAFSWRGIVEIDRETGRVAPGPRDLLRIRLTYLPPQPNLTIRENLFVRIDKLEQLLERRKAKRELSQGAVVN